MKYLKYIYLFYGVMGILGGIMSLTTSAEGISAQFTTSNPFFEEYTLYSKGFGNAIFFIAVISILTFFIKDYFAKKGLTLILSVFNAGAAYFCLHIENVPAAFVQVGYLHILLAIALAIMGLFLIKKSSNN